MEYLEELLESLAVKGQIKVHHTGGSPVYTLALLHGQRSAAPADCETVTLEQRKLLAVRAKNGDDKARDELIRHYCRQLRKVAQRWSHSEVDLTDLLQEAALAAWKTISKYDPGKIHAWDAYVKKSMVNAMLKARKEMSGITVSRYFEALEQRVEMSRRKLQLALNREPSDEELGRECDLRVEKIREVRESADIKYVTSLEQPQSSEDDNLVQQDLQSDEKYNADFEADRADLVKYTKSQLLTLAQVERQILELHYGLYGPKQSLKSVGKLLGISKQRVQQLEKGAFSKLRHCREQTKAQAQAVLGRLAEASSLSVSGKHQSPIEKNLTAQLIESIVAKGGHCTMELATSQLISSLHSRIRIFERGDAEIEALPHDEVAYWIIKHALARNLIRAAFGGDELVVTDAGLNWIRENRLEAPT